MSLPGLPAAPPAPLVLGTSLVVTGGATGATAFLLSSGTDRLVAVVVSSLASSALALLLVRVWARRQERRAAVLARALEKRSEQTEAREALLRAVVETTPLALLFYADAGRIVYANGEARRLFFEGAPAEGQNFLRLAAQAPEALRRALLGQSDELFSVELAGQQETYHVSRRTLAFDGETHTLLLVRHLTREISRREVEVLRKVIRVISHELNNSLAPVASLVHSARLIAKNPEHLPKLARVFDTIEERAQHLTAFLSGYADVARVPKPRPAKVEWAPFLEKLSSLFAEVRMGATPAGSGWFDAGQIEQVLINLLKNANESGSAPGDVELTVTASEGGATLDVLDRGSGLTPEAMESAFLPLYTTKEKGTGMGLPLCREIVEAHGGRISIRNREGGGTAVTCFLPGPGPRETDPVAAKARLTLTRS